MFFTICEANFQSVDRLDVTLFLQKLLSHLRSEQRSIQMKSQFAFLCSENKSVPLTPDWPAAKVTDSSDKCVAQPHKIWLAAIFPFIYKMI